MSSRCSEAQGAARVLLIACRLLYGPHVIVNLVKLLLPLALTTLTDLAYAGSIERTSAIAAFDEAQALMERGDTKAACTKFQESYELDAQLGSLLHLADCREQNGQFASAWGAFLSAAEWAEKQGDDRAQLAKDRAAQLAPRVSYLTLTFEKPLPSSGTIQYAGTTVPKALWGKRIPADEGVSPLEVSAEGYQPWSSPVTISGEGTTTEIQVPALSAAGVADATPAPDVPGSTNRSLMARKWPAFVAAGLGVAGGVVWGVFGVQSMNAKSDADDLCGEGFQCVDPGGTDLRQKAYEAGDIATIGAIVTGVGLGAAGVLWLVLPGSQTAKQESAALPLSERAPEWRVGVRWGGVTFAGQF